MENKQQRHYEIDWLRVLGMLIIFLFHTARFFDQEDWHVKNVEVDFGMTVFVYIISHFIMPLFFVLSAFAIYYALHKRSNAQFMRERATRLLVPLGVGIFTHIILQVYIENITHGRFNGSFWAFLPHYFDGLYGFGGNFAWMGLHLWYLLLLFLFSCMMLPVFRRIHGPPAFINRLIDLIQPYQVYLFILPLFLIELLVSFSPGTIGRRDFGGWSPLTYLAFFLIGYLLAVDERYRPAMIKVRFISMALSLGTLIGIYLLLVELVFSSLHPLVLLLRVINAWSWLLTLMGFASYHLCFSTEFLKYANQAVLPFYILHQTVIVIIGYFIRNWPLAIFPKYIFLAVGSFVIIMVLYEFGVKRVKVLRYLYGMKG